MKLHQNGTDNFILSTDDIMASGKNIGKNLTDVLNEQSVDINDLKKYTKWLYKYGGTGSKGGSGGSGGGSGTSTIKPTCQIRLCGLNIPTSSSDILVLGDHLENEKSAPLEIIISNINLDSSYYISTYTVNGITIKNFGHNITESNILSLENNFRQVYSLNLSEKNKGNITVSICYTYYDEQNIKRLGIESILINFVKDAYAFSTDIINNAKETLFVNGESIFYTDSVNINSGVNLKINYELQTDNDIIVRTTSNILSQNEFIINSVDRKDGTYIIPFNSEFISNTEELVGDYSIPLSYYSNGVRIYQEVINFTIVPSNDVFIKITPLITNAQIYKYYSRNNEHILNEYNIFERYYKLYDKLNTNKTLSKEETNDIIERFKIDRSSLSESNFYDDLSSILYDELNNYKYYVFAAGNISFKISPYMPNTISEAYISCQLGKLNELSNEITFDSVDLGFTIITAAQKNKVISLNLPEDGIYVFTITTNKTINPIYYYIYTYNKDTSFDWYRSNINNIFNTNKNYLHYYRAGNTTNLFNKYKNVQAIQQFASGTDIIPCNINNAISNNDLYDCLVSIGIQYSYINKYNSYKSTDRTPIITINSNDNGNSLKLDIYQDKIIIGEKLITLFLPKEENYNILNKDNYHLLSIYKRYLYYNTVPYYEICVYLDGVLEGVMPVFTNSTAVWNSVVMHPSNYSINLLEISYLPHSDQYYEDSSGNLTYLDDIAIAEYYYKYVQSFYDKNNTSISSVKLLDSVKELLPSLRKFTETEYGMIKVDNSDIIKDISNNVDIPIIVFEYNEDGTSPEFVPNFLQAYSQESDKFKWDLQNIYYSHGKSELDLSTNRSKVIIDDDSAFWYIELQGSSTMQYFVKNLTLGLQARTRGHIYLYSPNFKYNDGPANTAESIEAAKTYLPEKAFTLKADMVDSSHCNNTAIGEFVNNNTKKFNINFDNYSVYHKYVKNCLTGFPILTFIKVNSLDENNNSKEDIYFLGIYNFNLGRDSYFNMGYYDPMLLQTNNNGHIDNILKSCDGTQFVTMEFKLTNPDDTDLQTRESVIVAEIQGNNSYNDFSQYDTSILAPIDDTDDAPMFGDFVPKLSVNTKNKTLWHLQRLVEHVSKGGGYIFDYVLKKHLGLHSYEYSRYIDEGVNSSILNSANQVPTYRLQFKRQLNVKDELKKYLINIPSTDNYSSVINNLISNESQEYYDNLKNNLIDLIFNQSDVNENSGIKEAIIDYPSLSEYYTICMAFGLTDSIMKNLNVKTWNASWADNYQTSTNLHNITGKWYVAFYDMDTAFGRYNNGEYLDNSYFAFSDYWLTDETKLSEINIYRDFKPKVNENDPNVKKQTVTIKGFDVPSSYLFAIAKYAAIAMGDSGITNPDGSSLDPTDGNDKFRMYVPQNIWTKFRVLPENVKSTSAYYGLNGIGELRNANYFVNTYFAKHMNNIPLQLWNMNYRFKYLKRIKANPSAKYGYSQSSGFSSKELETFHGRGIYQVKDWLNYRLHMLDAYFNVDQSITAIKYLDYDKSYEIVDVKNINGQTIGYTWNDTSIVKRNNLDMPKWEETGYYDILPVESYKILQTNNDVVILKDVFSQNEAGNRYQNGNSINLNVKALEYSPLVIIPFARTNQKKHLLINPSNWYNITYTQTSSDQIIFGGSGLWTEIEDASSLIALNGISIFSDKIQNLVLTHGICHRYDIENMKSLRLISITKDPNDTISNFSGNILINSLTDLSNEDKHPNLTTIILDRTNISLQIRKSSVHTINYLRSTGNLELMECTNLTNLQLTSSNINECKILPGWSNKINIANTKINSLIISPKDSDGNNNELEINNVSTLTNLTISGNFKKITINNCPKLTNIYFDKPKSVETLIISSCNNENTIDDNIVPLMIYCLDNSEYIECTSLNENNEQIINLNKFVNLKELSFNSTFGFNILDIHELNGYLPNEYEGTEYESYRFIKLLGPAFENTKLKEIISNELYLMIASASTTLGTRTATFNNSYIGQDNHVIKNYLFIPKTVTSLSNLFNNGTYLNRRGGIDLEHASIILGNRGNTGYFRCIYENKSNITDLSSMFKGQNIVCSNRSAAEQLTLSSFENVSNISEIFEYTLCTYISKVLFEYNGHTLGNNVQSIKCNDFISVNRFEQHAFEPIINKMTNFHFYNSKIDIQYIYNDSGNLISDFEYFNIEDLFEGITPNNIISVINGVHINDSIKVNWNKLFVMEYNGEYVKRFPMLNDIHDTFDHNNTGDIGFTGDPGIGLQYLSGIKCNYIFNVNNINDPINYSIIHQLNMSAGFNMVTNRTFNMYKTATNDEIILYLNDYHDHDFTNLDYVFAKLILKTNDTVYHTLKLDNSLKIYKFTSMNYAFDSLQCINNIPLIIDNETLRSFTKVTSWKYAFQKTLLYKNLPLNMFNQRKPSSITYNPDDYNHIISNMEGMFSNVKISNISWFEHENYDININDYNKPLDGSYHYSIDTYEPNKRLYNPKCIDVIDEHNTSTYGTHIINHLVLPFDIFYACNSSCIINNCFENSDFEGIMPDRIFKGTPINENEYSNAKFENTFRNLLIIPNKVYNQRTKDLTNSNKYKFNFNILDKKGRTLGLYKEETNNSYFISRGEPYILDPDPTIDRFGKYMFTYTFVPSEFTKILNLNYAFNFKILLPNSPKLNSDSSIQEAYAIFNYDSIGEYNDNVFTNNIGLIKAFRNSLPGKDNKLNYIININDLNNSNGDDCSFNPTKYYNVLYFMMLPDTTKIKYKKNGNEWLEEEIFGLNRNHLGFTYQYSNSLKMAFENNGEVIFNSNLVNVLYGYYLNINENDNFINFSFQTLDPSTDISSYSSIISISGDMIYSSDINANNTIIGNGGIAKFGLLPNMINSENYSYVLELPGGELFKPTITDLNTLTRGDLDTYKSVFKNKFKIVYI